MLSGSNNDQLFRYKKVNPEYCFFYQKWQELLDSRTLDMYQYNILNSHVACVELLDVLEKTMAGLFTSRQNVDDVKSETLEIIKKDDILMNNNRPLWITLIRVLSPKIDAKQRNDAIEDKTSTYFISLNRLKYQLRGPSNVLSKFYLQYILCALKKDVDSQDYNQMDIHIHMAVSQCLSQGWSAKGLFMLSTCFEGDSSIEGKLALFSSKIAAITNNTFKVYYSIKLETRRGNTADDMRVVIASLGLNVKRGSEINAESPENLHLNSKIKSDSNYIEISVNTPDLYSAALSAINVLNKRISVATFYNTINPWTASSPQIVVFDERSNLAESLTITDVFRTYDYVDSNNNVFLDTKSILMNPDKEQIINKLHAAFSYTNLSRSSYFQETKYISLWIAIESVMRTGQFPDIISHVKSVLPEVLGIRYIYRVIRNFSEDCIRCGYKSDTILAIDMESVDKKELVKSLISIFRDPSLYTILQGNCVQNSLLKYRCNEIHQIVNDANIIQEKLDHYARKIRWHIQRLYRIRNEITHSAFQENKSLMIYIEHLYAYLSQMISEVVYYIEHKEAVSVEDAFASILENYNTYMELIKEGRLPIKDILPNGVIEL